MIIVQQFKFKTRICRMNDLVKLYLEYCVMFCIPRFYKHKQRAPCGQSGLRGDADVSPRHMNVVFLTEKNKMRIDGWRFQGHTQQFNSKMNIELSHTEKNISHSGQLEPRHREYSQRSNFSPSRSSQPSGHVLASHFHRTLPYAKYHSKLSMC